MSRRRRVAFGIIGLVATGVIVTGLVGSCGATPPNPITPRAYVAQKGLPVFPGAEGFGTRTPAGRGGKLIEVTTLADSGPGSLRAALDHAGPRIIVFRVSGTIVLKSELTIVHPFVTVAGQTAPGGGICLKDAGIAIFAHDVLIQHLRIRPGDEGDITPENNDAICIMGPTGDMQVGAYNVVIDHVSASWSEDETVSTWYGARDVTISWCIVSEALNRARHHKKTHSAGLLIGDSSYHVTVHHTLMAHNDFRNPLISKGGTHDIVNNVVYDWGVLPCEIMDVQPNSFLNFVGNTFIKGPSTREGPYEILITPGSSPKIYVKGNHGPHRPDDETDEWALVGWGWGEEGVAPESYRSKTPYAVAPVTAEDAAAAMARVLEGAGATRPARDAVDARVVDEVRTRKGKIIDSPKDVGGHPALEKGEPPIDTDHDGMPDAWERSHGLDPNDPADGNEDRDEDGYANIEEYLHSLLK